MIYIEDVNQTHGPPHFLHLRVHGAIQVLPIEYHGLDSMPVIECQGVAYYASRNLSTGDRFHMPSRPISFDELYLYRCIFPL